MTAPRIVVALVPTDDADEIVTVQTSPGLAFVTALGMLRMAELQLIADADAEDPS